MRKKLGELLLEAGLLDEFQLQAALGHQRQWGGRLGEIVVSKNFTTAEGVADCLARQMALPRTNLAEGDLDPRAAQLVPVEMAERHGLVPVGLEGGAGDRASVLVIATADPTDLTGLDEVQFRTGKRVRATVATDAAVRAAIRHVYHGADLPQPTDPKATMAASGLQLERGTSFDLGGGDDAPEAPPGPPVDLRAGASDDPLGAEDWDFDAGVSAIGPLTGAAAAPPVADDGGEALPEIDAEVLEEVDAVPVDDDGLDAPAAGDDGDLDADLDALGFGGDAPAAPAPPPAAPAPASPPPPPARPPVDDAHARAILDAIDALADGEPAPEAMQRYVNPTQMVAALIRLLIRQGVIDETAFVDELNRK